jgi:glycerol-3-phosphate O-acyltransferase
MHNMRKRPVVPEFLLEGDLPQLAGVLDESPPWLFAQWIRILSAKVRIDQEVVRLIQDAARSGPVIYAMKYRSLYDLHFLRMRFAELDLPLPAFVFETSASRLGSVAKFFRVWHGRLSRMLHYRTLADPVDTEAIKKILLEGGAAVLFLVDEKTSRSRYVHPESDPIRILLDLQGRIAGSITLLPMMILYDRTQRRAIRPFWESLLGDPDRPGALRRILTRIRQWTVPELLVGEPAYLLDQFEEFGSDKTWEEVPFEIRSQLIDSVNARIRVNRGPEKLSLTEIRERVLQDPRVRKAVGDAMDREQSSEQKARKKAEAYVDEIAADQTIQAAHFLYYLLRWTFSKIFAGIDVRESDFTTLKRANAEGSLIYVSCHKSHFDYLVSGYLSFINQMAIPHMAAGKNLAFWPVGRLLRKGGAFFLRRSFKGLNLYTHVFAAYVKVLVREKVTISYYIEGGRSRTGKLLTPKVGMLAFLLQAIDEGAVPDLVFVPTFVGYDQIPEEDSYLRELAGREKRKESFSSIIRARKILEKSFGRVYVRFHEPVSFREFCRQWCPDEGFSDLSSRENRKLVSDFAYHLMHGIVRSGVVTPPELVAAGLVCSGRTRVPLDALFEAVECFSGMLRDAKVEFADSLANPAGAYETALGLFSARGFVSTDSDSTAPDGRGICVIQEQRRVNLEFYKNSLVNYLWPASLLATVFLKHNTRPAEMTSEMRDDFRTLVDLFGKEFITDPLVPEEQLVQRTLDTFGRNRWIGWCGEGTDQARGYGPLESLRGILADLFEVYYLVLVAAATAPEAGLSLKDLARRMARSAEDLRRDHAELGVPPLPMVTVGNALARFAETGVLHYSAAKKLLRGVRNIEEVHRLTRFLGECLVGRITARDAFS